VPSAAFERPARATSPHEAALCDDDNKERTHHEQETRPDGLQRRERGKGQKYIWTRIGAAWPHSSVPASISSSKGDRIVLTEPKAEEAEAPTKAQ
jgi:hypothetical protein